MRLRVVSLLAGAAVLALSAGGALAIADTLDQHQDAYDAPSAFDAGDYPTAQTFTAGISGQLDRVSLYAADVNGSTLTVNIETVDGSGYPTGTLLAPGATTTTVPVSGWFDATFSTAPSVVAGSKYAIVFGGSGYLRAGGTCTAGAYSGGQALAYWSSAWQAIASTSHFESCMTAFAFKTYVVSAPPTQTTKLQWDKTQVPAGVTTPLTLTETFTFTGGAAPTVVGVPALSVGAGWSVKQVALPAWFTVAGVACSSQIALADCILANVAPGSTIPVTPDGNPIIVTLTGTASPAPSAGGTTGTATGEGCVTPVVPNPVPVCLADQATVAVGAFTVTAAPTTTGAKGPIGDSTPPLALLACLAFGGLGLAVVEVRRWSARG
jgi:hypothetical protein